MAQLRAILDAQGELYALATNQVEAAARKGQAEAYLDGAATCGHPAAGAWVRERLPIEVRHVTATEGLALLEEHGTPLLDREG
jgi:hypothetical protein